MTHEDGHIRNPLSTYLIKRPCIVKTTLPDFIYRPLRRLLILTIGVSHDG